MASSNNNLKVLLHDAKLAFRSKFADVVRANSANNPKLQNVERLIDATVKEFDNPELWQEPIEYDEVKIIEFTLDLNEVEDTDVDGFEKVIKDFLEYLKDKVLKKSLSNTKKKSNFDWNPRVFSALVKTRRRIGVKKGAFSRGGNNLKDDPAFKKIAKELNKNIKKYSDALNTNKKPPAVEKDKTILDGYCKLFDNVKKINQFKALHSRFNKYIKSKVPKKVVA